MHLSFLIFGIILAANHVYGMQQSQMPEAGAFMSDEDLADQMERIKHNITELWSNFNELKTVLTQTLNHLRVHQSELEETVHALEHKHDGTGGAHGALTDDHHHHHSGEHHSGDSHTHGSDDHHHSGEQHSHGSGHSHSGEQHSHGSGHSHSGEQHSHGSGHSHSGESHSHSGEQHAHHTDEHSHHSGEQHSHDANHFHSSYSHSHSTPEASGGHQHHGESHETGDNLQQAQQGADSMIEPLIQPTTVQQHYHHQHPHMGSANSLQLINDKYFNSHHHHHSHGRRNRTVEIPKFSEYALYDFAVCNVQPNRAIPEDQQQDIVGRINLWQKKTGGPLNIHVHLQGFDVGDHHHHADAHQFLQKEDDNAAPVTVGHKHGFHVHTFGNLSNGCQSTGPHYNPKTVNHGGPNALVRHVGDLGSIECDDKGVANIIFNDEIASLKGPYAIIGKSLVIHSKQDDYGKGGDEESLKTGNAGTRVACCIIQKVEKLPIRSYKFIKTATLYQNH